jgi:DNA invertase Pin-like site-specific DNA recombinase
VTDIAGRWLRVSTRKQDETNQVPRVDQWIADHRYQVGPTYRIQISAYTGHKKFDELWAQVLADFKAKRITVLVVWKTDRIDRKLETMNMLRQVADLGGRVEFTEQPHLNDLTTMGGRIALNVQMEVAHAESENTSHRVRSSFDRIDATLGAVRGRGTYGFRPVGDKYNKHLELVEDEAEHIRQAAQHYLSDDWTLERTCKWLNDSGYLPRPIKSTGYQAKWTPATLGRLFRSETLMGRFRQGDKIVSVPAILTVKDWKAVNAKLDAKAWRKGVRTGDNPALLTSLLFCPNGHALYRQHDKSYYDRHGCGIWIPLQATDTAVRKVLGPIWTREIPIKKVIKGHHWENEIDQLHLQIQDMRPADYAGRSEFQEAQNALWDQIEELENRPAVEDKPATVMVRLSEIYGDLDSISDTDLRQIMLDLGWRFEVNRDRKILLSN